MAGEELINNIEVTKEDLRHVDCGGGIRYTDVHITIDNSLPIEMQRRAVVHEILAAYLEAVVDRDDIEEIAERVCEGIESIEEAESLEALES